MSEEHMGDLGVIAMHYGERIPCDEICKEVVQQNPKASIQAISFCGNFVNLASLRSLCYNFNSLSKL